MAENKEEFVGNVTKSFEDFTINFYKMVAGRNKENLVCSALSAHVVLAMAAYGAKNKTAEEMRKVLHLPDNDDEAYQGFQNFIDMLNDVPNVTLKLANKIFFSNSIPVKDGFKKLTKAHFHSESEILNFSNPAESAKTVNQWCFDQTNGKVKEIITEDEITKDLMMVLLNAVYFKGNWKEIFQASSTNLQPFHIDKSTTVRVPTMHIKEDFLYKDSEELNAKCIMLPYKNKDIVMEIIVPVEIDGLEHIERNLEKIDNEGRGFKRYFEREIKLSLPKFKVESTIDLQSHLEKMGMKDMFIESADFTDISDQPMKVNRVLQKAYIEVNEEGSEAAAITECNPQFCCSPPEPVTLQVDRPFFYRIFDNKRKFTLFTGRVVEPKYD